jgi:uncharacterized protein (DUF1684 family)
MNWMHHWLRCGAWLAAAMIVSNVESVAMSSELPIDATRVDQNTSDYRDSITRWREADEAKLKAPRGWLALIAHAWLSEGENRLGNSEKDAIPVPKDLESTLTGSFIVDGDHVRFKSEEGSGILVNGEAASERSLKIDSSRFESNGEDKITVGDRVAFQLVRRTGRYAVRVRDAMSEGITSFAGKKWFEIDPKYRFQATYHPYKEPNTINIVNIRGDTTPVEIVGAVEFALDGQEYRLDAMSESPGELFLVFRDKTSGRTTYGPGRFLDAKIPTEGDKVDLDFNKSYNPPCAFSPHTLCPLPPKQNHLPIEIPAGEQKPEKSL